jgi:WD40 repeat protein
MGVVYRARDNAIDRDVAVKLLSERYGPDSQAARRFLSEARITGQLQHPGIPAVHQVGTLADGRPFLAMKLIKGRTLEAILRQRSDPSTDRGRLLAAFEAVCQAVGYAHAHRVIHRDLKPANVMVGAFGEVQVMDWGLAKVLCTETSAFADTLAAEQTRAWTEVSPTPESGSQTQAGSLVGTPGFIPPEQAIGQIERVNERSDVFGLGALLAVILTGKPPYVGESYESVRVQAVRGKLDDCFARLDASGAEPELVALCKTCLAFEPADRPADAEAVAKAVAAFRAAAEERARRAELDRVRVEGERATAEARAAERRKRRRLALVAATVLVAVLVLVTVTSLLAAGYFNRLRLSEAEAARGERDARHEAEQLADEARRRGDAERWQHYRANMAAAGSALQLQSSGAARRVLGTAPAEHRDWEWLHFTSRLDEARLVLPCAAGMDLNTRRVAFRPDGKQVATGQADGTVRVWDVTTGGEVAALPGQRRDIHELAFSPDGRHLLAFSMDGTLQSWTLATHDSRVLVRIPYQWAMGDVLSPDQRLLFCMSDQSGQLWDVATGRKRADLPGRPPPGGEGSGAFSPDGRRLAYSTAENVIRIWDLEAGFEVHVMRGHSSSVRALTFSPDGKRLASGSMYAENTARLWDVSTGKEIAVLRGHRNEIISATFSPDGTRLATASLDQTARLWDGVTGRAIATLEGHRGSVYHVAYRPGGRYLATSSLDGTLRLWDAVGGEPVAVLHGHTADVRESVFNPDGALLASASDDGTVRLWDLALAERNGVLRGHTSFVYDVAFSPDSTRAASVAWDGTVRIWDPTTCLQTGMPLPLPDGAPPMVSGVCFHPDGKQLASASGDGHVRVWNVASGKVVRKLSCPVAHWKMHARAAFSPGGTLLAAGGADGLIRLWGADGDEPVATLAGHEGVVGDVAFRPGGGQLASAGSDKSVRVWDVATRKVGAVLHGHTDIVHRVAYSADGRLLASASADKTVRLWDAATGEALAVLPHGSLVYGVAFNPRGRRLATACADNTIRLWDVGVARRAGGKEAPDAEVAELRGHDAYVHAVDWSGDGTRLISASGDGTVRVWDSLSAHDRAKRSAPAVAAPALNSPVG